MENQNPQVPRTKAELKQEWDDFVRQLRESLLLKKRDTNTKES